MRQTRADKFARIAHKVAGVKRPMPRQDGSVMTKPVVPCPPLPESEVTKLCKAWLERHGCVMDRLNNAAGKLVLPNGTVRDFQSFGLKGGGDFIGMLPNGRHMEVEFKAGAGGVQKKSQIKRMARVRRGNGVYEVVHGIPEMVYKLCPVLEKM